MALRVPALTLVGTAVSALVLVAAVTPATATVTTTTTTAVEEGSTTTAPDPPTDSTTAPPADPTTTAPAGSATTTAGPVSTTVTPPTDSSNGSPPGQAPEPGGLGDPTGDPDAVPAPGSSTDPAADPLVNEEQGEEAPAIEDAVPPKRLYDDQDAYQAPDVLWSSVAAAERKVAELEAARIEAIAEVRVLRQRRKLLEREQRQLGSETRSAIDRLGAATDRLQARSIVGFRRFGAGDPMDGSLPGVDYGRIVEHQRRTKMVDAAVEVDRRDLSELDELRASLDEGAAQVVDRIGVVDGVLTEAEGEVAVLTAAHDQARVEYEAFRAGSEIFIHGVVFPIAGPYSPVTDSFGFPRMTGTPDEHWHEGIDLFAPRGTPLVATERGIVSRVGIGRLGGLKLWIKGESGAEWYYAHLDSFAPGLADGLVVEAGQVVGYVGNTGNAVGTPPHLHLQLHPDGGDPVNPYPLLKVVSDRDRVAAVASPVDGR